MGTVTWEKKLSKATVLKRLERITWCHYATCVGSILSAFDQEEWNWRRFWTNVADAIEQDPAAWALRPIEFVFRIEGSVIT